MRMALKSFAYTFFLLILFACSLDTDQEHSRITPGLDGRYFVHHHETGKFDPKNISCVDRTTADDQAKLDAIRNNPAGDLYLTNHINEILPFLQNMANRGNVKAMGMFGDLKYEFLYLEYGGERPLLPDWEKTDEVAALTYMMIEFLTDKKVRQNRFHSVYGLQKNSLDYKIPQAWFREAQANAKLWMAQCGHANS